MADIAITSNCNGLYTLVIEHKTYYDITLDEAMAIISGKESEPYGTED